MEPFPACLTRSDGGSRCEDGDGFHGQDREGRVLSEVLRATQQLAMLMALLVPLVVGVNQ